jgi:aldehyde:ferredoxin oxidoreductase
MSRAGTILWIDLTDGKIEKEPTSGYVKDYIGGALIGARIFWEKVPPDTRPFDPRNLLMFNTGPLTGTLLGNKSEVASKAPEPANNPYVHVGMGGQFPSEMKFAGYDHIAIKGKAERPVYLFINNDNVEIRDARHLWGLQTHETQRKIKEELGDPDVQIACIGPAGENLVVYALILHDICNTASRRGLGAVMGSKNLKAIAVRGTRGLKVADPKAFLALFDEYYDELTKGSAFAHCSMLHREGLSRQISEAYVATAVEIPAEVPFSRTIEFNKKYMVGSIGCAFCPIQCHQNYSLPGIGAGGTSCTSWFGVLQQQMYGATDYELWWKRSMLADRYGIDHLSIEMLGGWLVELYKRGIITEADTDGIPMEWGSERAVTNFIEKLARGEGFGKGLAGGVVPAARRIGKGTIDLADQHNNAHTYAWAAQAPDVGSVAKYRTGDVERLPGWLDRYSSVFSYAEDLGLSTKKTAELIDEWCSDLSERITGDRNVWKLQTYDKRLSLITIEQEDVVELCDVTGHCEPMSEYLGHQGVPFGCEHMARWLSAATGTKYTKQNVREAAQKLRLLVDAYNVLCARAFGEEPVVSKRVESTSSMARPGAGRPADPEGLKKVQEDYCHNRGYDPETGVPIREVLEKLGLKDVADKLDKTASPVANRNAKRSPKSKK